VGAGVAAAHGEHLDACDACVNETERERRGRRFEPRRVRVVFWWRTEGTYLVKRHHAGAGASWQLGQAGRGLAPHHQEPEAGAAWQAGRQDGQHRGAAADHCQLSVVADVPVVMSSVVGGPQATVGVSNAR
jgi:hypothetical protein